MTRRGTFWREQHRPCKTWLERRGPDRHCLIDPLSTLSQPTGDSHDDPDQQSFFDEIGRLMNDAAEPPRASKREVRCGGPQSGRKNPARLDIRQA